MPRIAATSALARTISAGQLRGEKGAPRFELSDLAGLRGNFVTTGCRKG